MATPNETVWVLLREADNGDTSVHAVYRTRADLDARMERLGERNPQYPLERMSADAWRIGPEEDEGFFGNKPLWFRAVEKDLL